MEYIIKVDADDNEIGTIEKLEAHRSPILHRAFSVFLYNGTKMLIQKRALNKYHSGGLWANACCSHPRPNKPFIDSVYDRIAFELGITSKMDLEEIYQFKYLTKYSDNLFEHEYDHVLIGKYSESQINFNPEEIAEVEWIEILDLKQELSDYPEKFCSWFKICAPIAIEYIERKSQK